jgi:hypothetical protein
MISTLQNAQQACLPQGKKPSHIDHMRYEERTELTEKIFTKIESGVKRGVSSLEEVCNEWSCVPKKNLDI